MRKFARHFQRGIRNHIHQIGAVTEIMKQAYDTRQHCSSTGPSVMALRLGCEQLFEAENEHIMAVLKGRRVGLITNPTGARESFILVLGKLKPFCRRISLQIATNCPLARRRLESRIDCAPFSRVQALSARCTLWSRARCARRRASWYVALASEATAKNFFFSTAQVPVAGGLDPILSRYFQD